MFPNQTNPKKTDAINGAILLLVNKYDVDWYPVFHNKRSLNRVLNWMQSYKMKMQDLIILRIAYDLTYNNSAAQHGVHPTRGSVAQKVSSKSKGSAKSARG